MPHFASLTNMHFWFGKPSGLRPSGFINMLSSDAGRKRCLKDLHPPSSLIKSLSSLLTLCRYDDITECFWQRPQLARMLKGLPYLKKARSDKENERFEQEVALKVHCRAILRDSPQFSLTSYPHR